MPIRRSSLDPAPSRLPSDLPDRHNRAQKLSKRLGVKWLWSFDLVRGSISNQAQSRLIKVRRSADFRHVKRGKLSAFFVVRPAAIHLARFGVMGYFF
jgi:hypothetical protein